ncbi:topology modulation protein [Lasius niger]|uniref:Topology modulation protein n=1 Tax=Lasius niger TaxID=67767 RepID=A0A0J7K333_LASNI|nr:topology modulation protein [Lasius niger]
MNRYTYMKSVALECKEPTFSTLQLQILKVKLDLIDNNWQKFEATHERMAESKSEALLEHDYIKKGTYDQCLRYYADAQGSLIIQIEEKEKANPLGFSTC